MPGPTPREIAELLWLVQLEKTLNPKKEEEKAEDNKESSTNEEK